MTEQVIQDIDELPEPRLTDIAIEILNRRYLIRDDSGVPIETPKDMFWRVAEFVASADLQYGRTPEEVNTLAREFYYIMSQGYWLPNSPTLSNAGRPLGQLSACFVLPVEDSLTNGQDGIYDTLTNMAVIHQSGGGTGFSFNRIRPANSIVRSSTGVASGPISFMQLYDASTDVVKQGGTRRGANMGILRVDHPDILDFIDCKTDTSQITNFNVSVAVTDEFMKALDDEEDYGLKWKGLTVGKLSAQKVWDKICHNAWATGEPGLFFIDEANRYNPVPGLGEYEATNPCGEQPLLPYDVCNLGSLNLGRLVENDSGYKVADDGEIELNINWEKMAYVTELSMHFLDNVIDLNKYPLPEIEARAKSIRRVGNGVMGWADMLIKLGVPYGSELSFKVAEVVAEAFVDICKDASEELAEWRGVFPEWIRSIHTKRKQRHCNVTTVAPTGTISMIAGCSGGIEPIYAVAMQRNQAGAKMFDVNSDFIAALRVVHTQEEIDKIVQDVAKAGTPHVASVPESIRELYKTSSTVSMTKHITMQAIWQQHICSAISKTINMPHESTVEDVKVAYRLAHTLNCKGVTVYRDGSRPEQVLSTGKTKDEPRASERSVTPTTRPESLDGTTVKVKSPIGGIYVTVNSDAEGRPYEVFAAIGKAGGTGYSFGEAIGRLISLCLRSGVQVEHIYHQLRGISSERTIGIGPNKILSGPDAIAYGIGKVTHIENGHSDDGRKEFAPCPECNSELYFSEGCAKCVQCGYSQCS